VHTEKGGKILEAIKSHIEIQEEDVNSLVTENGVMVCNSAKPHPRRAEFYQLAEHYPIDKALNKIDPITLKDKIIEKSKRFTDQFSANKEMAMLTYLGQKYLETNLANAFVQLNIQTLNIKA
jgi:hypothetical protein